MSEYRPFMEDPEHRALLEGQRYVVLRPEEAVSRVHRQVQDLVRERLSGLPASYPTRGHVTLTGFPKGTPLEAVQGLVRRWAPTVAPLSLEVDGVGFFPDPTRALFVRLRRTPELFHATVSLREFVKRSTLPDWPEPAPEDWVFHMSATYCPSLSASAWDEITSFLATVEVPRARCTVNEAEIVAFDEGHERSGGVCPLSGSAAPSGDA